jgi:hypothetical protein
VRLDAGVAFLSTGIILTNGRFCSDTYDSEKRQDSGRSEAIPIPGKSLEENAGAPDTATCGERILAESGQYARIPLASMPESTSISRLAPFFSSGAGFRATWSLPHLLV